MRSILKLIAVMVGLSVCYIWLASACENTDGDDDTGTGTSGLTNDTSGKADSAGGDSTSDGGTGAGTSWGDTSTGTGWGDTSTGTSETASKPAE